MKKLNKIFTTAQIAEIDQYTIERESISSLQLMERAATIWCEYFLKNAECGAEVIVVAGNGNNGGDGYVIARLLKLSGKNVCVYRLKHSGGMSPDCEMNYKRWVETGGRVQELGQAEDFQIGPEAVIVDALFGAGLNRKIVGVAAEIVRKINCCRNKVYAVDLPSGLMGENNAGNDPEAIIRADCTLTFQFPKLAFMLPENAEYVGRWHVLDIGWSEDIMEQIPASWYYTTIEDIQAVMPMPKKYAHKGTNGKGLLVAGRYGMMGGAVLAAKSALRSGIGVLHCHVPELGGEIVQITVPEAILDMDESKFCFSAIKYLSGYDAIAVGPALGQAPETVAGLRKLLQDWRGVTILDADALNLIAEHRQLLELLHERCILTPHIKEFERLAGKSENDFDRLNKLSIFANQYQVHVILKGAHSVVATPDGSLFFNMSGNPGMAKGGAGDVLTGVLLALAANKLDPLEVARIGVFAHGLAADLLVEEQGFRGISAGMIAEGMGKAWKQLEKYGLINDGDYEN